VARPHALSVDKDRPGADCLLHLRPGGILNVAGQEEIKALFLLSGGNDDIEDGVQG